MMHKIWVTAAGAGLLATVAAGPVRAAADTHVRGTVTAVDGSTVTIKTQAGQDMKLTLGDSWKLGGVEKAAVSDIKPGTFIGTANMEGPGGNKALEVVVFPPSMKGTGEGDYGWDLKPNSKMTNATVSSEVKGVAGQTVALSYKGGTKKVTIGKTIPIVKIVPADRSDVKPGAKVFLAGQPEGDTMMSGGRMIVGKDGATPPM